MELKRRKLRMSGGFSFAELMLTMLILALMTGMAATGIPVVKNTYQRAVDTANAETYLNTTMIALRSRLCVSSEVTGIKDKNDNPVSPLYLDPKIGYYQIRNSDKGIQIEQYLGMTIDTDNPSKNVQLLAPSEKNEFVSSFNDIKYTNGFFTITGLQVEKQTKQGKIVATLHTPYVIHTVNP